MDAAGAAPETRRRASRRLRWRCFMRSFSTKDQCTPWAPEIAMTAAWSDSAQGKVDSSGAASYHRISMGLLLVNWVLSALCLVVVAKIVSGFELDGCGSALLAAIVVGFVNSTLGAFLRLVTLPLTLLTLGWFIFIVNALMLKLAAALVPGFRIKGLAPAFWGAIVLSLLNFLMRHLFG